MTAGSAFIGRREELASLRAVADVVAAGTARLVLVSGDAGVGKTTLVEPFVTELATAGWLAYTGYCLEYAATAPPFAPVTALLRSVLLGQLDDNARVIGAAQPELARLLPELDQPGLVPRAADGIERLHDAVCGVLIRAAQRRPLVLVIEDLQWADASTRDLLSYLTRHLGSAPILIVANERTNAVDRTNPIRTWLAELRRQPMVVTVEVPPLTGEELGQLAEATLGERPGASVIDHILARSGGIPFYGRELLAAHRAGTSSLPDSLVEFIAGRLDQLEPEVRALLRSAAVVGARMPHKLLASVVNLPDDHLNPMLRQLVEQRVLVADGDGYAFRLALVREVLLLDVLPFEAETLHRACAEALEALASPQGLSPTDQAELAVHWAGAGERRRGLEVAVRAGDAASSVAAFDTALSMYELALDVWPWVIDAEVVAGMTRLDVLVRAADAAVARGWLDRGRDLLQRARADWVSELDGADRAFVDAQLALVRFGLGEVADADVLMDAARSAVIDIAPSPRTAAVLSRRAALLQSEGRFAEGVPAAREAIAHARAADAKAELIEALVREATFVGLIGEIEEADRLHAQARSEAKAAHAHELVARSYNGQLAAYAGSDGLSAGVEALLTEALAYVREHCGQRLRRYLELNAAVFHVEHGDALAAEAILSAMSVADDDGDAGGFEVVNFHHLQAQVGLARGRLDRVAAALDTAEPLAAAYQDSTYIGYQHRLRAELARRRGHLDDAAHAVDAAVEILAAGDDRAYLRDAVLEAVRGCAAQAEVARLRRDETRLHELAARGHELALRFKPTNAADEAYASAIHAELLRTQGRATAPLFTKAAARFDDVGLGYEAAQCRLAEVELMVVAGDRAEARALARQIYERFEAAGLDLLRLQLVEVAKRARIDLGPVIDLTDSADEHPFGLTDRELEVLAQMAEGLTNKQIGERLFVSAKTVATHVSNVLAKLGVTSRGEAAAVAHRLRLVTPGVIS